MHLQLLLFVSKMSFFLAACVQERVCLKKYFSLDYSWFEKHNKNYTFVTDKMKKQPWEKSINCFHFESTVPSWTRWKTQINGLFLQHFFKLEGHEINTDITGHIDVFISRRRFTQNESLPFSLT